MDLILLLEDGLRRPGGLQGDLEYIQFERNAPEKAFGKLLEMIQALRPKAKSVFVPEQEKSAAVEEPLRKEQKTVAEWLEPKESWHKQDYEIAVCHMIATGDTDGGKRITDAFFATNDGQIESNRLAWEAQGEHLRLEVGKGGTLAKLKTLARSHPENSDVHWYLGRGYEKYSEHERAAESYSVAAERTNDTKVQLRSLGAAALAFLKAGKKDRSQQVIKTMKDIVPNTNDGEIILVDIMRKMADIEKDKQLFFGATERLLQLNPDDVDSRFSLAYEYSQANQNDLSLYYYLKIPYDRRQSMAWNNLGVQFDFAGLPSKSVEAYRKSEDLGETLAMSNLAEKLLKAGFVSEARDICDRATKMADYHQKIGRTIAKIKSIPGEEQKQETSILDLSRPLSEFYRDFGRAASRDEITEHNGRWQGPDCELQIMIKGNVFTAEGTYEVSRSGQRLSEVLSGKPPSPPITEKYQVSYTGKIHGHAVDSTVTRKDITASFATGTFLTDRLNHKRAVMIVSDSSNEIRVGEQESSDKFSFYTLTRLG